MAKVTVAAQDPLSTDALIFDGQEITGSSESFIVRINEQVSEFPAVSVATNVFVVAPTGKAEPEASPAIWVTITPGQLSVAVTE